MAKLKNWEFVSLIGSHRVGIFSAEIKFNLIEFNFNSIRLN